MSNRQFEYSEKKSDLCQGNVKVYSKTVASESF